MLLIATFTVLIAAANAGLYGPNSRVVTDLNASNFQSRVVNSGQLWIVEFYADWCGYCKRFAPEYEAAANALGGIVNVAAVDAHTDKQLGAQYGIRSYPTVKIFVPGFAPVDYNGERTSKGVSDIAIQHIRAIVERKLQRRA